MFPASGSALLIAVATFLAYLPALRAGFIWDDDHYVTANLALRSLAGLRDIWFDPKATPQYYPLVHTTFWIEYQLHGLHPAGYHFVNIALHALTAVLFGFAFQRLSVPGGWIAAAIFALHPIGVESVAWVTERKNVLSGALYAASLLAYISFEERRNSSAGGLRGAYSLSLGFFVGALLSKTVACTLPASILILAWWRNGRVRRRDILPLLPFFAAGAVFGLLTAWLETHHVGARGDEWNLSILQRALLAGRALTFYAWKIMIPTNLAFSYPRWTINPARPVDWIPALGCIVALGVAVAIRKKFGRGPAAALLFFAVTLSPALGFINVFPFRYSYVADHFQYLAGLGPMALAGGLFATALREAPALRRNLLLTLAGAIFGALAVATFAQARIYHNQETLWLDTLAKNPESMLAYSNLGSVYADRGQYEAAVLVFEEGLKHEPRDADLLGNLGGALTQLGRHPRAIEVLTLCIEIEPGNPWAQNNLGVALSAVGRAEEAKEAFRRAIAAHTKMIESYRNLARLLAASGQRGEARAILRAGIGFNPGNSDLASDLKELETAPSGSAGNP